MPDTEAGGPLVDVEPHQEALGQADASEMGVALPFKVVLSVANAGLLLTLVGLVLGHLQRRYKKRSTLFVFHCLCLVWLAFRMAFWTLSMVTTGPWQAATFYFVYWLPHPVQFAMYATVPYFYAYVLACLGKWEGWFGKGATLERRWTTVRNVYVFVVAAMVVFMCGCVVAAGSMEKQQYQCLSDNALWHDRHEEIARSQKPTTNKHGSAASRHSSSHSNKVDDFADDDGGAARQECYRIELSTRPVRWISAVCALLLAVGMVVLGYQMVSLAPKEAKRFLIEKPHVLGWVNGGLFVSFATRGVYELGTLYGLWFLPDLPLNKGQDLDPRTFACMVLWDYLPIVLLVATFSTAASGRFAQRSGAFVHLDPSVHMYDALQTPAGLHISAHGAAAAGGLAADSGSNNGTGSSGNSDVENSTGSKRGKGNPLFSNFAAAGSGEAKRGSKGYGSLDSSRLPGNGAGRNSGSGDPRRNPNGYSAAETSRGAASFPRWTQSLGLPWGAGSSLPAATNEATARNLHPTAASRLPRGQVGFGGKGGLFRYPSVRRGGGGESKSNSGGHRSGGAGARWGGVPSSLERVPVRGPSRETYHMALVDRERLGSGLAPLPPSLLVSEELPPQAHHHHPRGGGGGGQAAGRSSTSGRGGEANATTPPPLQVHPVDHGVSDASVQHHPQRPSADLSGVDSRRVGALGNLVAARAVGRSPAHPPPMPMTTVGHFPPPVQHQQQRMQQQQQQPPQPLQPTGRRPGVTVSGGSGGVIGGGLPVARGGGAQGFYNNYNAYDNLPEGELKGAMELEASLGGRHPHHQPYGNVATTAVQQQQPPLPLTPPPPPPLQPTISPYGGDRYPAPHPALSLTYTLADAPSVHYPAAAAPVSGGAHSWSNSQGTADSSKNEFKKSEEKN